MLEGAEEEEGKGRGRVMKDRGRRLCSCGLEYEYSIVSPDRVIKPFSAAYRNRRSLLALLGDSTRRTGSRLMNWRHTELRGASTAKALRSFVDH
jgi:hypothetical protein